jgi:phenylacetate-coenzyme A ligase PaaK-like adenylate-forming protein
MNFSIKDFNKTLCYKCNNGQVMKAADETVRIHCSLLYQGKDIHPYIIECTTFEPKGALNDYEMKKVAWILELKHGRIVGFKPPEVKE